ncbi:hypothetical protein [Paraburkholderia dilworthii]|uniref:Uncharacterized protein n=1 Tax=Paraburkholderia dilworthii TaxID=948106 RepID=A0ABW9D776_9BURK
MNRFKDFLRGVSPVGVAVALLTAVAACVLAGLVVGLALRGLVPPHFVLAVFPLAGCTAALLASDVWRTREENLDRRLGLSFRGEQRDAGRQAYADLWRENVE